MANKMIIDASHPEETRVVVLKGNRVEEFDFEAASKKPLRGNIYLAKVTRVEPSLQAAFIDYGGNRHGFLAFSEIHPDYYQIPVADRQALLEEEARSHQEDEEEPSADRRSRRHRRSRGHDAQPQPSQMRAEPVDQLSEGEPSEADLSQAEPSQADGSHAEPNEEHAEPQGRSDDVDAASNPTEHETEASSGATIAAEDADPQAPDSDDVEDTAHYAEEPEPAYKETAEVHHDEDDEPEVTTLGGSGADDAEMRAPRPRGGDEGEPVEVIGGDALDEAPRRPQRVRRHYKIQEVIKRRQVMLVQVVKEERGNKGAALTTYLSLAGRYSVLMPNTARGGGISRKITNTQDRSRLKSIAEDLEVPEGMGVILRTAGAARTKQEVKRDFEYLLRMWETVRETTLSSTAPTLVYEEGSLIKRAIRDLYSKDIEEITVAGEAAYREARAFMRLLMPTHVKAVVPYRDTQPLFAKSGVEAQLDAMFSNQVTLKSGGYIVINQTEALVAIDVNSGRSTREHNIEDTATRTNLEAADEVAHQLRLRDLAGLIVVDFIDMEEPRNNRAVERRMKEALKNDRARIQVGRISHFGLLEMSRQRIRAGVLEGSTVQCAHCMGAGVVRSTSSIALLVLRMLEDAVIRSATHDMIVRTRTAVALYILNQKRAHLRDLERRFGVSISVENDETLSGSNYHSLERGEPATGVRATEPEPAALAPGYGVADEDDYAAEETAEVEEEAEVVDAVEDEAETGESEGENEGAREGEISAEESERRRRRRRRRRRGGAERPPSSEVVAGDAPQPADDGLAAMAEIGGDFSSPTPMAEGEETGRANGSRRRRSRRGRRGERFGASPAEATGEALNAAEEFEGEGSHPEPEIHPLLEGEADATPLAQPELPWHMPLAEEPQAEAPTAVASAAEPPHAASSDAEAPQAEASFATTEPVVAEAPIAEPPAAEPPDAQASGAPETPAPETPATPAPAEPAAPAVEEPPRPRRSGWWQRAAKAIVSSD